MTNKPETSETTEGHIFGRSGNVDIFCCRNEGVEVVRIDHSGRIYWKGREVETDDDYRVVMMEIGKLLVANMRVLK